MNLCGMDNNEKFKDLNDAVYDWAKRQRNLMKEQVGRITLRDKHAIQKAIWAAQNDNDYKPLKTSIGSRPKKNYGNVYRINFPFSKQGIWLEHGVGNGRKRGTSKANPKPWIAPILDASLQELADIIAKEYADVTADEIKFFVPGIIDRRIKINNG